MPTAGRWREVARFEIGLQRREFLTGVYVAVFFFLTFGYTSSEAVELVGNRGAIPRNAPWALAHAMAGVTAFGQVITTMITATAVMRDVATRQQELLFTTPLTRADYLLGRWGGALVVMLVVYAAIPLGLVAGTQMPWVASGALLAFDTGAYLRPLLLLVLPNVLLVSALFFAAGALGRSFMTLLLLGVVLVVLWSSGVALVRDGAMWGALIDPFGNAPLEAATRGWSEAERASRVIPVSGVLVLNRAIWLTVAAAAMAWLLTKFRMEVEASRGVARRMATRAEAASDSSGSACDATVGSFAAASGAERATVAARAIAQPPTSACVMAREAAWTLRWTLRERGFATLAFLGTLNALANAWRAGGSAPSAGDILGAVQEHSRVFLILVATIHAGELVWRERDVRVDGLRDALPAGSGTLVSGRLVGLVAAEGVLVLPLLAVALIAGYGRGAEGMSVLLAAAWVGGFVFGFLVQLTMLSLLVHAVVQHKVAGHVLLIIGWVLAVALERTVAVPPLARYANLPAFQWSASAGFGGSAGALALFVLYWTAAALACGVLASAFWVRGIPASGIARGRTAVRALAGSHRLLLVLAVVATGALAVLIAARG